MDFYNLDKYNSYTIMKDRYVYCVHKTHRYAHEKEITMEMLKDEPIILFNTDSVQTQTVITQMRSAGITPNIHMYCSQLVTILNFIRGGKCGAFLYSLPCCQSGRFLVNPCLSCDFKASLVLYGKRNFCTRPTYKIYNIYKKF